MTDAGGLRVGHFTDQRRPTGCTVILFDQPARAGADYNGSAPAESLGVTLQPTSPLDRIHAILLAGGGPMALGATAGVVRFLEEQGVGYDWGVPNVRVPIVVGAAIDDLAIGDGRIRVGADEAYRACQSATTTTVLEGSVGAGAGATVGKLFVGRGMAGMKGGVGCASARLGQVVIAALVVVNAAGDIIDWRRGTIVAGARTSDGRGFARTADVLRRDLESRAAANAPLAEGPLRATTLARDCHECGLHQNGAHEAGNDGQHGRRARDPPVSHAKRRRSDAGRIDRIASGQRIADGVWRDRRRSRGGRRGARSDDRDERHRLDCGPRFVNLPFG